jgi:uncharacterized protein YsxB (DUF464 family)
VIVITHSAGKITISGHAGYAPPGQDIVCAAISTLTQVFVASIEELTTDKIKAAISPGNAVIEYGNLTEKGRLLLDSFLLGTTMISENYPAHVRIEREVKNE